VSCVAHLTNDWKAETLITEDKRMLSRAVLVRQMIKMETKFSILLTTALIIVMLFNWMAIVMV
jgi:hypothetical protein